MTKKSYDRRALEEAVTEHRALREQRDEIDKRIALLREEIVTRLRLLAMRGEAVDVTAIFESEEMPDEEKSSLTEAIGDVLKASDAYMSASDIKARLTRIGFDVSRYADPLPTITTTLSRLVKSGDVLPQQIAGKSMYKWNTSAFKESPLKYLGQRQKAGSGLRALGGEPRKKPSWWQHLMDETLKEISEKKD